MKAYQALAVAKSAHMTWTSDLDAALLEAVAQHGESNMAKGNALKSRDLL